MVVPAEIVVNSPKAESIKATFLSLLVQVTPSRTTPPALATSVAPSPTFNSVGPSITIFLSRISVDV